MNRITLIGVWRAVAAPVLLALTLLLAACGGSGTGAPTPESGAAQPSIAQPAAEAPVSMAVSQCDLLTEQEVADVLGQTYVPRPQWSHEGRTLDCTWGNADWTGKQLGTQLTCDPEIVALHEGQNRYYSVLRTSPVETHINRQQYGASVFAKKKVGAGECWMSVTAAQVDEATTIKLFDTAYERVAA